MFRFKFSLSAASVLFVLLMVYCFSIAGAEESRIAAKVGDEIITEDQLREYMAATNMGSSKPAGEKEALEDLITRSIMYQEAKKKGIDRKKDVQEQLAKVGRNIIIQALMKEEAVFTQPVTEETARELYEKNWMDSRYPRWVKLTIFKVTYKDNKLAKTAEEYAGSIRTQIKSEEFDRDPEEAIKKLREQAPPPDGIAITATQYKKIFLLKVRQVPVVIEQEPLKMKVGETSDPLPVPQHPEVVLINLTHEYPQEELPFEKVKSDLMFSGAWLLQKERMKQYLETHRNAYKIEYLLK